MRSKAYRQTLEKIDKTKLYTVEEAVNLVLSLARGKFTESVDLHLKMMLFPLAL